MRKTSIILPSYVIDEEVHGYQERCLDALLAKTPREAAQIIIIDNGSKYGSERMREVADIYIRKDYPMGYARAVNCGFTLADHDDIAVINNDLFVQDNWLQGLQDAYDATPGGIMSPFDFPVADGPAYMDHHWYSLFYTRKDVLTKVGYFDESINYRYHDQDYSIRTKMAGYEVMRTPKVIVSHINSATYDKMEQKKNEGEEARIMLDRYGFTMFEEWVKHFKRV